MLINWVGEIHPVTAPAHYADPFCHLMSPSLCPIGWNRMHFEPLIPPKNVKNEYLKHLKDLACITAIPADSQVKGLHGVNCQYFVG